MWALQPTGMIVDGWVWRRRTGSTCHRAAIGGGDRRPLPGRGGALAGPVVLYNIPYRTGRALGAAALLELAGTEGIVGLKQAVGGVDADTLELLACAPADFAVLCGDDAFLLPLLLMGARGAIAASAHLCTERFAALVAAAHAGRIDEAREHAEALLALVLALFAEPSPAVLKAMLHEAGRIATPACGCRCRPPRRPALERARRSAPSRSSARAPARAR